MGILAHPAWSTETEHLGMRVLPAPGKVTIDGKVDDWDLSGGIFACGHIEGQRAQLACWFHVMYDAKNLYLLARWVDHTPMNNPNSAASETGFRGDCLQVRFIMPQQRFLHVTAWSCDKDKKHRIDIAYGKQFNEGNIRDARQQGARQAFQRDANGKGYSQEISFPWKLLTRGGAPLGAGARFTMTIEPNFTIGGSGRLSIKDIFKPGVKINRYSTFNNDQCWGTAAVTATGNVNPWPVRLSDGRQFAVKMQNNTPVVNWGGGFPKAPPRIVQPRIVQPPTVQPVKVEPKGPPRPKPVLAKPQEKAALSPRLTVTSTPITGVSIFGDKPGATNYTATCDKQQKVALLADAYPSTAGEQYNFVGWKIDGADKIQGMAKAEITMNADHSAVAVYELRAPAETEETATVVGEIQPPDPDKDSADSEASATATDDLTTPEADAATIALPAGAAEALDKILTVGKQNIIIAVIGAVVLGFLVGRISVPRPRA